jgi:hypothetical protein
MSALAVSVEECFSRHGTWGWPEDSRLCVSPAAFDRNLAIARLLDCACRSKFVAAFRPARSFLWFAKAPQGVSGQRARASSLEPLCRPCVRAVCLQCWAVRT